MATTEAARISPQAATTRQGCTAEARASLPVSEGPFSVWVSGGATSQGSFDEVTEMDESPGALGVLSAWDLLAGHAMTAPDTTLTMSATAPRTYCEGMDAR